MAASYTRNTAKQEFSCGPMTIIIQSLHEAWLICFRNTIVEISTVDASLSSTVFKVWMSKSICATLMNIIMLLYSAIQCDGENGIICLVQTYRHKQNVFRIVKWCEAAINLIHQHFQAVFPCNDTIHRYRTLNLSELHWNESVDELICLVEQTHY